MNQRTAICCLGSATCGALVVYVLIAGRYYNLSAEIRKLSADIARARADRDDLSKRLAEANSNLETHKRSYDDTAGELATCRAALGEANAQAVALADDVHRCQSNLQLVQRGLEESSTHPVQGLDDSAPRSVEGSATEAGHGALEGLSANEAPKLIPFTVIKREEFLPYKVSYDIRVDLVDGRLPTQEELGAISTHLHASEQKHERTFVCFYFPGMKLDAGAFATAHHTPDLRVRLNPGSLPARYKNLVPENWEKERDGSRTKRSEGKKAKTGFDFTRVYDGSRFDEFAAHHKAAGLTVGKKTAAPFRALRGASDGCQIEISGDAITVFYFDVGTKAGRNGLEGLRATGWVEDGTYLVNGGLVLLSAPDHRHWARILEAFRKF